MTTRLSKSALLHSAFAGLTFQYIGVAAQALVQLGVIVLLARLLRPADFGLVGLATVFVSLASLLSQFGVGVGIIRTPALTERQVRAGFTLFLGLGLGTAALLSALAPLMAEAFGEPRLVPVLRVLSLSFLLANPGFMAEALLERALAWRRLLWAGLASVLAYAAAGVTLAALGWGYWALVGSHLAQAAIRTTVLLGLQPHAKRLLLRGGELRELTRFGGGLTLARLFNYGAQQGDYLVVGHALGVGPLGYYTRAFKLMLIPAGYFAALVTRVLFPVMARLQGELDQLRRTYLLGSAAIVLGTAPVSALMVVTAPELVEMLLGPRWAPAVAPFQILTAGVVLRNASLMAYCLDGALGDMRKRAVRDGLYASSVLLGSLSGVRYGLSGVATGVLGAIALNYLIAAAMSLRLLRSSWTDYLRTQVPGFAFGLLAAALAFGLRQGLHQLGMPAVAVLVPVWVAVLGCLLLLLFFRPSLAGRYGVHLLHLTGAWCAARLPARSRERMASFSSGLVRRVADARTL